MSTEIAAVTLWRPVGPKELDAIRQPGMRAFPPRLPEQPIFYPVLSESYTVKIARDWNLTSHVSSSPRHSWIVIGSKRRGAKIIGSTGFLLKILGRSTKPSLARSKSSLSSVTRLPKPFPGPASAHLL